jgi:phage recombination protein Bet
MSAVGELQIASVGPAFTKETVDLIKSTIAKDASDDELKLFLYQCEKTGLNPLAKQIYFQKRFNKRRNKWDITIITGIDGYRLIADRTGKYAGNDDPVFDDEDNPRKATVTVYKLIGGVRCAFTAAARWEQYYPGDEQGFMWRKMPHLMLGKCAEALALRKAFPAELSGVYVKEEMDQAEADRHDEASELQAAPAPKPKRPVKAAAPKEAEVVDGALEEPPQNPNDTYKATEPQRAVLRKLAAERGIKVNRDLFAISTACVKEGRKVGELGAAITDWIEEREYAAKKAQEQAATEASAHG